MAAPVFMKALLLDSCAGVAPPATVFETVEAGVLMQDSTTAASSSVSKQPSSSQKVDRIGRTGDGVRR